MKKPIKVPEALKYYVKQFCSRCGGRLICKKMWQEGFDSETGRPEFMYRVECVNHNPWVFWEMHTMREYKVCVPHRLMGSKKMHTTVLERETYDVHAQVLIMFAIILICFVAVFVLAQL